MLSHLQDVDKTNEYIVLIPSSDLDYWKPKNANFSVVPSDYKSYSLGEQFGFFRQLYSLHADLVHFCMPQQPILYLRPHVTSVLDLTLLKITPEHKNKLVFQIKKMVGFLVFFVIGHTSRHILTISEFTRQQYAKFARISPEKITVTHLAADTLSTTPTKPDIIDNSAQYILFVGQQNEHKNVRRLIHAHQLLLKKHPKLLLVFAGKIKDAVALNKNWVEASGYKNIIFTNLVTDDELVWLYNNCRAVVVPSIIEGFGLPGVEAMKHDAPLISSNAACLPEIYGDAAQYFNPFDIDDMASTIDRVIHNVAMRREMIKKGTARVKEFSWQRMAEQTVEVYRKALGL